MTSFVSLPTASVGDPFDSKHTVFVSPNGSNTNTGREEERPVQTATQGLLQVGNGGTVLLEDADYSAEPALSITKQNVTLTCQSGAGPGGVKAALPGVSAVGLGPKLSHLKVASLNLSHAGANGAHTAALQVTGATMVNSAAYWEDHGSKFVGNVTLAGAGATYMYGSQFEGNITASSASGFVALTDCVGDGATVLTIPAGVVYSLRNCSGMVIDISSSAVHVVDAVKAAGATEAQAWAAAQATSTAINSLALNIGGRLTVKEVAVANQPADAAVAAAVWERAAALTFGQTTAGRTITLAAAMDNSVMHARVFTNAGTASMGLAGYTLAAGASVIGVLPAGSSTWLFIGCRETSTSVSTLTVKNASGATLVNGETVYQNGTSGGVIEVGSFLTLTDAIAKTKPLVGIVKAGAAGVAPNTTFALIVSSSSEVGMYPGNRVAVGEYVYYRPSESAKWANTPSATGASVLIGRVVNNIDANTATIAKFDPSYVVPDVKAYAKYRRGGAQTAGIGAGGVIYCDVAEVAPTSDAISVAQVGRWALKAGKFYRLRGCTTSYTTNSASALLSARWYDETAGAYIGMQAMSTSPTTGSLWGASAATAEYTFKPAVDTIVSFRVTTNIGVTGIGGNSDFSGVDGSYPWIEIEELL